MMTSSPTKIRFPEGLPGFTAARSWELIAAPEIEPFMWLTATDAESVRLLVAQPTALVTGYEPQLSKGDAQRLGLTPTSQPLILTVVTLWEDGSVTANLRAPLYVNTESMLGAQVILDADRWPLRHLLGTRDTK
jgi:flagellar assembly factor FliW